MNLVRPSQRFPRTFRQTSSRVTLAIVGTRRLCCCLGSISLELVRRSRNSLRGWGLTRRCLVHRHRSLSPVSGQQLVDFLIFKSHLDFTTRQMPRTSAAGRGPSKYQWQCLAFGVSTTESLEGAWSIATVNLSPFGKQQLVDFQIFKGRVCFIHQKCAAYLLQIEGMTSVSSRCEIWRVERRCHKDNVCQCKALGKGEEGVSNCRFRNGVTGVRDQLLPFCARGTPC